MDLRERVRPRGPRVAGSRVLQLLGEDVELTVRDLRVLMFAEPDNAATKPASPGAVSSRPRTSPCRLLLFLVIVAVVQVHLGRGVPARVTFAGAAWWLLLWAPLFLVIWLVWPRPGGRPTQTNDKR